MATFVKRFLYIINILSATYVVFVILFLVNSIGVTYKNLVKVNNHIEEEYDETLNKYKKAIALMLKNNLPQNINYFNLMVGDISYNLPPVKEFEVSKNVGVIVSDDNNKLSNNTNISYIKGCDNKCIKISADRKEILHKILKNNLWKHSEITTIPVKKATLLKMSVNSFLESHKNFLVLTLLYLFILYLFQSLFLFIDNNRLIKTNISLLTRSEEYNKLCDGILFIQNLVSGYFTHYVHELLIRDVYIEEVDLVDILQRTEKFFNYQKIKSKLKIILDYEDTAKIIKSDNEIMFVILLNLIFKAMFRSKISSKIAIKILRVQNHVLVKISNIGYDYSPNLNSKIQIYTLPKPILENLYQKIGVEVEETRKGEVNIITAKIILDPNTKGTNAVNDNIIKLDTYH